MTENLYSKALENIAFRLQHYRQENGMGISLDCMVREILDLDSNTLLKKDSGCKQAEAEFDSRNYVFLASEKIKSLPELILAIECEAQKHRKMVFSYGGGWFWCESPSSMWYSDTGKQITWIRCKGRTAPDERINLFKLAAETIHSLAIEKYYNLPISGKIATEVNEHNMVPMLFYTSSCRKDDLLELLEICRVQLKGDNRFRAWFEKPTNGMRTATWNWYWKTDAETYAELNAGTHYINRRKF